MGTKVEVPLNPALLVWARKEAGFRTEELADEIKAKHEDLLAWERGDDRPGKTAFKKLCTKLGRAEAVFFLPTAPDSTSPLPVFRKAVESSKHRSLEQAERQAVREARRVQRTMRWVSQESAEEELQIPAIDGRPPVEAADEIRAWLGWAVDEQLQSKNAAEVIRKLLRALHAKRILVLHKPLQRDGIRGFALWDDLAPLICVNTAQTDAARIFTMAHELAHVVHRDVAVDTGELFRPNDVLERWCEEFAAAFLLPQAAVELELARQNVPIEVTSLDQVSRLANRFRVSVRAMVLRLVSLGRANWSLYRAIPPSGEFKEKAKPDKPLKRPRTQRRRHELGSLYVSRLADAQDRGLLSHYDLVEYLDVKKSDLPELRDWAAAESAG